MGILDAPGVTPNMRGQQAISTRSAVALRNFRLALADRDTNPCDLLHVGDSISSGYKATALGKRWSAVLRDTLRTRFPQIATGGVGYISANPNAGSSTTFSDNPVAVSGGAFQSQNFGLDTAGRTMTGAGHTITVTFTGTGMDFTHAVFSGGGTFSWAVDGGSATNINTNGTTDFTTVSRAIRGLTAGSHTVVFSWVSGGTVYWTGAAAYNGDETKGIRSWSMAVPGVTSGFWWNTGKNQWWDLIGDLVSPDLVTIELGPNDYGGVSPLAVATYKSNLQSIISKVKANVTGYVPSFVLLPVPALTPQGATLAPWSDYVAAMYDIAAADADGAVCVLDLQQRINPGSPSTAGGVLPDTTHPADAGNRLYAEMIAGFASPA